MAQPARRLQPDKSLTMLAGEYRAVREATLAFSPLQPAPGGLDMSALGLVYRPLKERNQIAVLINRALKRPLIASYPVEVQINNIGFCNLRCPQCPTHGTESQHDIYQDKAQTMSRAMVEKVTAENFPYALKLATSGTGEGLLHKDVDAIIAASWRYGVNFFTNTNGTTLLPKLVGGLFGVTELRLSIDGATPAGFEAVRRGAKYRKVMRNVLAVTRANERLPPTLRLVPTVNYGISASNIRDMPVMVDLCAYLGLQGIHGFRIVPLNPKYINDDIEKYPAYYKHYYLRAVQRAQGRNMVLNLPAPRQDVLPDPNAGPPHNDPGMIVQGVEDSYYRDLPGFDELIGVEDMEPEIEAMMAAAFEAGIARHSAAKPTAVRHAAAEAQQLGSELSAEIQRGLAALSSDELTHLRGMHKSDRLVHECFFLQAHLIYNATGIVRPCCDVEIEPVGDATMKPSDIFRGEPMRKLLEEFRAGQLRPDCLRCGMWRAVPEKQIFPMPLS